MDLLLGATGKGEIDVAVQELAAQQVEWINGNGPYKLHYNAYSNVVTVEAPSERWPELLAKVKEMRPDTMVIVKGRGVFHIHPKSGPVFAVQNAMNCVSCDAATVATSGSNMAASPDPLALAR